jgi:hypothetical protein
MNRGDKPGTLPGWRQIPIQGIAEGAMVKLPAGAVERIAAAELQADADLKKALSVVGEADEIETYLPAFRLLVCTLVDAEARELLIVCEDAKQFQNLLDEAARRNIERIFPDDGLSRVSPVEDDTVKLLSIEFAVKTGLLSEVGPDGTRKPARPEIQALFAQYGYWENTVCERGRFLLRNRRNNEIVREVLTQDVYRRVFYWNGQFQLRITVCTPGLRGRLTILWAKIVRLLKQVRSPRRTDSEPIASASEALPESLETPTASVGPTLDAQHRPVDGAGDVQMPSGSEQAAVPSGSQSPEVNTQVPIHFEIGGKNYPTALGRNIDRYRKECGWSFDRLAEATGLDKKLILGHVNEGKGAYPSTLKTYADGLSKKLGRTVTVADLES